MVWLEVAIFIIYQESIYRIEHQIKSKRTTKGTKKEEKRFFCKLEWIDFSQLPKWGYSFIMILISAKCLLNPNTIWCHKHVDSVYIIILTPRKVREMFCASFIKECTKGTAGCWWMYSLSHNTNMHSEWA